MYSRPRHRFADKVDIYPSEKLLFMQHVILTTEDVLEGKNAYKKQNQIVYDHTSRKPQVAVPFNFYLHRNCKVFTKMKDVYSLLLFYLILNKTYCIVEADVSTLNGQHIVFGTLTQVNYRIEFKNSNQKFINAQSSINN